MVTSEIQYLDEGRKKLVKITRNIGRIGKIEFISSFGNEEIIVRCLMYYFADLDSEDKISIICSLTNPDLIMKCLKSPLMRLSPDDRAEIVLALDDDEFKMRCLLSPEINLEFGRADYETSLEEIVMSFKDDKYKKMCLDNPKFSLDNTARALIVSRLQDKEDKLYYFHKYDFESSDKAIIICSLEDDDEKLRLMQNPDFQFSAEDKLLIICSLKDKNKFKKFGIEPSQDINLESYLPQSMTIGVELETEGDYAKYLKGIGDFLDGWNVKGDSSLEDGVEVSSPKMHWSNEDFKSLKMVCNILRKFDLHTSERCGEHIHYGADFLGTDYKAWENFFTIYSECEEIFYKMTNRKGEPPREDVTEYAQSSNRDIMKLFSKEGIKISDEIDLRRIIKGLQDTRDRGVNFCNIDEDEINTIEFRMPNGTIDFNTIMENIRLFGQLLYVSKQLSEEQEFKKDKFSTLKRHDLTEREKLESLLDLLFDDEDEKEIYRRKMGFC